MPTPACCTPKPVTVLALPCAQVQKQCVVSQHLVQVALPSLTEHRGPLPYSFNHLTYNHYTLSGSRLLSRDLRLDLWT